MRLVCSKTGSKGNEWVLAPALHVVEQVHVINAAVGRCSHLLLQNLCIWNGCWF